MSDANDRTIILAMVPRFGTVLLVLFALTGSCHCGECGFDRDYLGDAIDHHSAPCTRSDATGAE